MVKNTPYLSSKFSLLTPAVNEITELLEQAHHNIAVKLNQEILSTYWNIGEVIVRYEQKEQIRAAYGEESLQQLSKALTAKHGRGFSRTNLQNMRLFYLSYQNPQTTSTTLSWSHYCELLVISDPDRRSFYEKECILSKWSVRELKRQRQSMLFERPLLTRGESNQNEVLSLAQKGVEYAKPSDIIHDPYVFEFLGLPGNAPILENELEDTLVRNIGSFLLELGRGFMFVGTQQRVPVGDSNRYVDMVFYNKLLRAYVLIELKSKKFMPEAVGQLNMYLNYYKAEVNDEYDNPPIGIILCTDKNDMDVQYALGGLSNQVFVSQYVTYMPEKEQLLARVDQVIEAWHEKKLKEEIAKYHTK